MKITKLLKISVFLFAVFLFITCKQENLTPDPCFNAEPFKASLKIAEIQGDSLIETDTVLINSTVSFSASTPVTSFSTYKFHIGTMDTITEKNEIRLFFGERYVSPGDLIKVKVIATGKPNTNCFPNDKSTDTIEKSFRIIHWKDAPIIGKYAGYFGSDIEKKDKQVVEVKYNAPDNLYTFGRFELYNINKGCNLTLTTQDPSNPYPYAVFTGGLNGARFMVFIAGGETGGNFWNNCSAPGAVLRLQGRDTLNVKFSYSKSLNEAGTRIQDSFNGIRIH